MNDKAQVFGMQANQAVAVYLACITVLGMMADEQLAHEGKDHLEDAVTHWHQFCAKRNISLPTPKDALNSLKASTRVQVL